MSPPGGGQLFTLNGLMGGGNSKCPSPGVSFSLDRGGERCVRAWRLANETQGTANVSATSTAVGDGNAAIGNVDEKEETLL